MSGPYYADGRVTLWHGDCREVLDWLTADVLVTDPPYGMAFVSGYRAEAPTIAGDESPELRDWALDAWGDRPALVFGTWRVPRPTRCRIPLVWWKRKLGAGMGDLSLPWGTATEEIYVLGEGFVGRRQANVIVTDDMRGNPYGLVAQYGHPSAKPVGLMELLVMACPPGVVADPFAGSGSTLVAARNLGRRAVGIEIDERYCEVIARRLAQDSLFAEVDA